MLDNSQSTIRKVNDKLKTFSYYLIYRFKILPIYTEQVNWIFVHIKK